MSLQVEKMEKNMAKLTIEVSAEELDKAMQNAYLKACLLYTSCLLLLWQRRKMIKNN